MSFSFSSSGGMWIRLNRAMIANAESGVTTHVVKGSQVVAHVVPANARVVRDATLLDGMIHAHAEDEAAHAAEDAWRDGVFMNAGDPIGETPDVGMAHRHAPALQNRRDHPSRTAGRHPPKRRL